MRMRLLLVICLSIPFVSCKEDEFVDKPDGWNCTYFFDKQNSPYSIIEQLKKSDNIDEIDSLVEQLKLLKPDKTGFYCNGIKTPEKSIALHTANPDINKARCMPLSTAEAYDKYLTKKYRELKNKCQ